MIRRPPRSTQSRSSAASDVYKRQAMYRSATGVSGVQPHQLTSPDSAAGTSLPPPPPPPPLHAAKPRTAVAATTSPAMGFDRSFLIVVPSTSLCELLLR